MLLSFSLLANKLKKFFILSISPVFVTMQISKDLSICEKVIDNLDANAIVVSKCTAKELFSIMDRMEFTVGMRLHFLVFSVIAHTPTIGLSYDPKINSLIDYIGINEPINTDFVDNTKLLAKTEDIINNRNVISETLKKKAMEMKEMNKADSLSVHDLLSK